MTVATEAAYAEAIYTGVETTFTPGFSALNAAAVVCGYLDASGLPIELTAGVHFAASIDPNSGAVTVSAIAFPSASAAAPVTIYMGRDTPATQGVNFENLGGYDPSVHEAIADAGAMRDAELKSRQTRAGVPFSASSSVVDFRPLTVRAADPISAPDLATKAYADLVSGTDTAGEAAESALSAAAQAAAAKEASTDAFGSSISAAASAALLGNPDYGFVADAPTDTRDYGTIP